MALGAGDIVSEDRDDWRDVLVVGEIKSQMNSETSKASFKDIAGKISVMLNAQDGRHGAPALQMLGSEISLIFFDRGGSVETNSTDIHTDPEIFLQILLGLSRASLSQLGFDSSVLLDAVGNKRALVARKGGSETTEVAIENILFISDVLHGRGTTVWSGSMDLQNSEAQSEGRDPTRTRVVIKDCWIDPLRKYTEGSILATLNAAGITGVPEIVNEEQVRGPHPTLQTNIFNNSTHLLRASLPSGVNLKANKHSCYQLRVLSRLLTTPVGLEILQLDSLAGLLVAFIDYVLSTLSPMHQLRFVLINQMHSSP